MCISQGSNLRTVDIRRKLRHTSPLISLQKSWKLFRGLLLQASSSMEIPRRMKRPIALSRQCSSTTTKDIRDLNITGPQTQRPHRQHTNWHIATLEQRQSTVENESQIGSTHKNRQNCSPPWERTSAGRNKTRAIFSFSFFSSSFQVLYL
jgi:hypothetical protein